MRKISRAWAGLYRFFAISTHGRCAIALRVFRLFSLAAQALRANHVSPPTTGGTGLQSRLATMLFTLVCRRRSFPVERRRQAIHLRFFGVGASCPQVFRSITTGIGTTHRPPPSLTSGGLLRHTYKDTAMSASDRAMLDRHAGRGRQRPARGCRRHLGRLLQPTAGHRQHTHRRQHHRAELPAAHPRGGSLRRPALALQELHAGQCMALARIDRANAGQTFLLELLHAIEHTRVDGDEAEQVAMARAKGCCLLFVRWPSTWMCSCARCEVSGAATRGVAPLHMR